MWLWKRYLEFDKMFGVLCILFVFFFLFVEFLFILKVFLSVDREERFVKLVILKR